MVPGIFSNIVSGENAYIVACDNRGAADAVSGNEKYFENMEISSLSKWSDVVGLH